jgi:PIN domain nuclease of toxin-antitoxin system
MIVLDTCAVIWNALAPERLSAKAKSAIAKANRTNGMYICSVSFWEIAMLIQAGRFQPGCDFTEFIEVVLNANHYIVAEITPSIAELSAHLPTLIAQDPVDRIIVATAITYRVPLVTGDERLHSSPLIPSIW